MERSNVASPEYYFRSIWAMAGSVDVGDRVGWALTWGQSGTSNETRHGANS